MRPQTQWDQRRFERRTARQHVRQPVDISKRKQSGIIPTMGAQISHFAVKQQDLFSL